MEPCSTCREKTNFREIDGEFYCDLECQIIGHYRLSNGGGGGVGENEFDWGKPPSFFDSDLKQAIEKYLKKHRKGSNSIQLEYSMRELDELETRLIRNLKLRSQYISALIEMKNITQNMVLINKEIENSENERSKLSFPMDGTLEEEDQYLVALEVYNDYILEKQQELKKLLIQKRRKQGERLEYEKLPGRNYGVVDIVFTEDNLEETQNSLIERIRTTLDFMKAFKKKFPTNRKDSDDSDDSDDDSEESISSGRFEVIQGMTALQKKFFDSLVHLIKDSENFEEKCDERVGLYLKKCDVIVHLSLKDFLQKVVASKDIYLRNIFETGKGRGSNDLEKRKYWEHKIFLSPEYDAFEAHEKVKYGTVNWACKRTGVSQLEGQYGDSYLIISDFVKQNRCTYTRYDSSVNSVTGPSHLGTYRTRMCSIVKEFTEDQKREMRYEGTSQFKWPLPVMETASHYMEVQIHGELLVARDVSKIMVSSNHKEDAEFIQLLQEYFKVIGKEVPWEFI